MRLYEELNKRCPGNRGSSEKAVMSLMNHSLLRNRQGTGPPKEAQGLAEDVVKSRAGTEAPLPHTHLYLMSHLA